MSSKSPMRFPSGAAPGRRSESSRELTSEKIATDMDAFRAAGGKVEVLGTTVTLKRLAEPTVPAAPAKG
jgi:hypothetical protein